MIEFVGGPLDGEKKECPKAIQRVVMFGGVYRRTFLYVEEVMEWEPDHEPVASQ
jgi:hypothetical protein